jgi:hypothetical protein
MKQMIMAGIALVLTACGDIEPQIVIRDKLIVVDVPVGLYYCPVVTSYPNTANMTDIDVARLLVQLQRNNVTCFNSIEAIRNYLNESKKTVEKSTP